MKGFTLMELVLVMAIIGILAVVGIGTYTQATVKSRDTQRKNDLNQIAKALELFNLDINRYPKINAGKMTCLEGDGTEALCGDQIYAFVGDKKAVYIEKAPTDPKTGRKYVYTPTDSFGGFALYAALENSEDKDIVRVAGEPTDWGVSCGDVNCNYKITQVGLVKTL